MVEVAAALHEVSGFHEPWNAHAFAELLAMPGTAGMLALIGKEPAGLVLWRIAADEAEILTICTLPGQRRGGVGRNLLGAAIGAMTSAGARRLLLEVAIDNRAAIALYRAFGLVQLGRRRGYYLGPQGTVDALILGRDI
ncbi:MAG TPA: GNAT family N-acetyltransferase [Alphaproteobacteria bacterium]|nr:GNAT family N-acetyltransferase [Alphaproteobacteria bacterium]